LYNYTQIEPASCQYYEIIPTAELDNGQRVFVEIDEKPIVLFNIAGGYYAIADVCSHDDGPVGDGELDGYTITCPRHGAQFDIRNGEVLSLPAIVDIPAYPVRVVNGKIEIGIPDDSAKA
jgi:3-phenylpropionate/trans-cinnamate dioxygenase ferredoxin subunit